MIVDKGRRERPVCPFLNRILISIRCDKEKNTEHIEFIYCCSYAKRRKLLKKRHDIFDGINHHMPAIRNKVDFS